MKWLGYFGTAALTVSFALTPAPAESAIYPPQTVKAVHHPNQATSIAVDAAVTDITGPTTEVEPGDAVFIDVTIANLGSETKTFDIGLFLTFPGPPVNGERRTLEPEAATTITLQWNTGTTLPGDHYLTARVFLDGDQNPNNDSLTMTTPVTIADPPQTVDAAVTNITGPTTEVEPGDAVFIDVTIANLGSETKTFDIGLFLTFPGPPVNGERRTLEPEAATTITLQWNTGTTLPGDHYLTARVFLDGDQNPNNDSLTMTTPVTIADPPQTVDAAVTNITGPTTEVEPGDAVFIDVTIANLGSETKTFDIGLFLTFPGPPVNGERRTLEPEAATTITLQWNTGTTLPGDHYLTARVFLDGDQNPNNDSLTMTTPVTIADPPQTVDAAVTNITGPTTEVEPGDAVFIDVTIANLGSETKTFDIGLFLTFPGPPVNGERRTLEPEAATTITLQWNTRTTLPGDHYLTARVFLDGDQNPNNDSLTLTTPVTIADPPQTVDAAVTNITGPTTEVEPGATVFIDVTIANLGSETKTFDIGLFLTFPGPPVNGEGRTLEPEAATTITLQWNTGTTPRATIT